MSALFTQIKADQLEARKACNTPKTLLLTTLIGETALIGKNENREVTDNDVLKVVKKFIDGIDDCLKVEKDTLKIAGLQLEKAILDTYRPKQLNEQQMFEIIKRIRADKAAKLEMKDIMQTFKAQFFGMYDGTLLSKVAKDYIAVQV